MLVLYAINVQVQKINSRYWTHLKKKVLALCWLQNSYAPVSCLSTMHDITVQWLGGQDHPHRTQFLFNLLEECSRASRNHLGRYLWDFMVQSAMWLFTAFRSRAYEVVYWASSHDWQLQMCSTQQGYSSQGWDVLELDSVLYTLEYFLYTVLCASESQRGQNPEEELKRKPILLQSRNPAEYRNDVLSKIIPRILNPLGTVINQKYCSVIYNFYCVQGREISMRTSPIGLLGFPSLFHSNGLTILNVRCENNDHIGSVELYTLC